MYRWLLETFSQSPKEKLLEFLARHPNIDELKKLPQPDLAKIY